MTLQTSMLGYLQEHDPVKYDFKIGQYWIFIEEMKMSSAKCRPYRLALNAMHIDVFVQEHADVIFLGSWGGGGGGGS